MTSFFHYSPRYLILSLVTSSLSLRLFYEGVLFETTQVQHIEIVSVQLYRWIRVWNVVMQNTARILEPASVVSRSRDRCRNVRGTTQEMAWQICVSSFDLGLDQRPSFSVSLLQWLNILRWVLRTFPNLFSVKPVKSAGPDVFPSIFLNKVSQLQLIMNQ